MWRSRACYSCIWDNSSARRAWRSAAKKTLVLAAVGVVFAAGLTLLFADSAEKYCIDYRVIRLTPFVPVTVGGFALCLALYGALKNVKKKSVLSYIGANSLLFYLFDNLPEVAVG